MSRSGLLKALQGAAGIILAAFFITPAVAGSVDFGAAATGRAIKTRAAAYTYNTSGDVVLKNAGLRSATWTNAANDAAIAANDAVYLESTAADIALDVGMTQPFRTSAIQRLALAGGDLAGSAASFCWASPLVCIGGAVAAYALWEAYVYYDENAHQWMMIQDTAGLYVGACVAGWSGGNYGSLDSGACLLKIQSTAPSHGFGTTSNCHYTPSNLSTSGGSAQVWCTTQFGNSNIANFNNYHYTGPSHQVVPATEDDLQDAIYDHVPAANRPDLADDIVQAGADIVADPDTQTDILADPATQSFDTGTATTTSPDGDTTTQSQRDIALDCVPGTMATAGCHVAVSDTTTQTDPNGDTTTTTTDQPDAEQAKQQCGLDGQAACNVKVDEEGTPTEVPDLYNDKFGVDLESKASQYTDDVIGLDPTKTVDPGDFGAVTHMDEFSGQECTALVTFQWEDNDVSWPDEKLCENLPTFRAVFGVLFFVGLASLAMYQAIETT